jgi:6-phosphogluconolactonase
LYSVNEMTDGHVSAYAINQANGTLSFLNTQSANGKDTTHLSVQPSGKYLFAANYTSGNFPVFRILANGFIGPMTDEFQSVGNGTGPNAARQEGPHAHQILTDLDGNHVFGVDLGADKVNVLNLDPGAGVFSANTVPFAPVASGSGPRHMAFHPDRQHAYVLDELASSITVFDYDPVRAAFIWKQTISTLPADFTGTNTTAEIRIHPDPRGDRRRWLRRRVAHGRRVRVRPLSIADPGLRSVRRSSSWDDRSRRCWPEREFLSPRAREEQCLPADPARSALARSLRTSDL